MFLKPLLASVALLSAVSAAQATVSVTSASSTYSQDFDSLASTGTTNAWSNDVTLTGWSLFAVPAISSYSTGTGSNGNTAGFYAAPEDVMSPFSSALEFNDGNFGQFTCWSMPETPGSLVNSPCVWVQLWVQLSSAQKVADYRGFLRSYAAEQARAGRIRHPTRNAAWRRSRPWPCSTSSSPAIRRRYASWRALPPG